MGTPKDIQNLVRKQDRYIDFQTRNPGVLGQVSRCVHVITFLENQELCLNLFQDQSSKLDNCAHLLPNKNFKLTGNRSQLQ